MSSENSHSEASFDGASVFDEDVATPDTKMSEEQKRKERGPKKVTTMRAEVKHLDKRFTTKGKAFTVETKDDVVEEQIDFWQQYALCIIRQFDNHNKNVQHTTIQFNSTHLKALLKELIVDYPGVSFQTKEVSIRYPSHQCLYHARHEISAAKSRYEEGSVGLAHLQTLIDFIEDHFAEAIAVSANLSEQGLINYEQLWTIMRPGSVVVSTTLGEQRAFKLENYQYACGNSPGLSMNVSYTDFDGDDFGTRRTQLKIPAFAATARIAKLSVHPLDDDASAGTIKASLIARGRVFESLAGQNLRTYQHVALDTHSNERKILRFNVEGRVMIDCRTFHRLVADDAFSVLAFEHPDPHAKALAEQDEWTSISRETASLVALSDEQCLLASATVRGFSFNEKRFLDFFVRKFTPIDWNAHCFEQLVLPSSQKELVQALVADHSRKRGQHSAGEFDDIVKGKGLGLILVLHGPPGVGKTLTAECVAEYARRPLYIVSSGELGTDPEDLDDRLSRILDMASTWNAVLLIDEADVFLERRSLNDMQRNGLVSIFLRVLEYYQGILFMTTNRVRTFDDAFKSRIHVPLKYDELPQSSRRQIWGNFLAKVDGGVDVDAAGYDSLSEGMLNGRQIKNVVRTAKSLASHKERRLDLAQLQQVMDIQMAFERDLNVSGGDVDIGAVEH